MSQKKDHKFVVTAHPRIDGYHEVELVVIIRPDRDNTVTFFLGNYTGAVRVREIYSGQIMEDYEYSTFFSPHSRFDVAMYALDSIIDWEKEHPKMYVKWKSLKKLSTE